MSTLKLEPALSELTALEKPAAASVQAGPARAVALVSFTASVAVVLVSVAASQILLAAAVVTAIPLAKRRLWLIRRLAPVVLPLLLFVGWTVLAALSAPNVPRGLLELKKSFLYLILFLTPLVLTDGAKDVFRAYRMIFLVAAFSGAAGFLQFAANPSLDLQHRVTGFMSHWMTFSGLTMLVLVSLAAYAVGRKRIEWWVFPLGLLLTAGLYLSETRSAWLGSIAGLTTVFALRRPRALISLAVLVAMLYLASPTSIRQRLHSGWDPNDPETGMRLELLQTSFRIISNHPWLGVGPKNVNVEALRYRGAEVFPDWLYQHMHNNPLQIAAERGIPGLILWLWVMGRLGWDALAMLRSGRRLPAGGEREHIVRTSTGALGALAALMVAGMFEYNFGDSEVVTLFLFLAAAPYALRREPAL